jgi:hypothetical protein
VDIFSELEDIHRILTSASILASVRQEVAKLKRDGMVVTNGSHQEGCDDYDVIVRCGSEDELVARRLSESMPDAQIERVAEGIVGLRQSRRQ